ncbi:YpmS family protein [Priestia megaterium]|uniref:YpmS family protein n=1 Tax=Priestia megaterium TaxID=1404 RepID=UPI000EFA2B6C|nr:YpmS family protein [Priestia megaterium]RMA91326.1 uncharacterized protein YpmS [Priestia megaterium]
MKKWKTLFIALLGINVLGAILIIAFIFQPVDKANPTPSEKVEGDAELTILAKKADLNVLIDKYLKKEFKNQPLNYKITLTDVVRVDGTIQVFGDDINIRMTFDPIVQKNGDIVLEQQSLSVGKLQLPVRTVLRYVNNNFALPEWVTIDPKNESVYVALQQMKLESDFAVKVQKFDIKNDDIRVRLISRSE